MSAILVKGPAIDDQWETAQTIAIGGDDGISHLQRGYLGGEADYFTAMCGQEFDDETGWFQITPLITCEACAHQVAGAGRAVLMDDEQARAITARIKATGA